MPWHWSNDRIVAYLTLARASAAMRGRTQPTTTLVLKRLGA